MRFHSVIRKQNSGTNDDKYMGNKTKVISSYRSEMTTDRALENIKIRDLGMKGLVNHEHY